MKCRNCRKNIEKDWNYCYFCGTNLETTKMQYNFLIYSTIISILVSIFIYFYTNLKYDTISNFFNVIDLLKIITINICIIGILGLIFEKNFKNTYEYIIMFICIISVCISSLTNTYENSNYSSQKSYNSHSTSSYINSTQSNYHKCEYPGCTNYASKTTYCSIHNQTTCSKAGCSKKEAYQGAGLCIDHLSKYLQQYSK